MANQYPELVQDAVEEIPRIQRALEQRMARKLRRSLKAFLEPINARTRNQTLD